MIYQPPFRGAYKVSLPYGKPGALWRCGYHSGLDLVSGAAGGDGVVYPVAPGKVIRRVVGNASYGSYVTVQHADGMLSLYAHLDHISVTLGQQVGYDTVLGFEGATGNATGPHLHLELHEGAYHYPATIDPAVWLGEHKEAPKLGYHYMRMPRIYAVRIDPVRWTILKWGKGKRTTAIKNYCCFAFQASGTVPVGNIVASGKSLAKLPTASTIWATYGGEIGVGFAPPISAKTAVSGFPLLVLGREYTLKEALAQGWDTSPLYATSHALLGVGMDGYLHYYVFETTAKGAAATWMELQDVARMTGCHTVLLGDGGGSTILDVGGSNMVTSAGNRQLATLMTF